MSKVLDLTLLIFSCEKFSDLWDAHVKLLEKYWGNRNIDTYIVTDKPHEKNYSNVKIMPVGKESDFSDRIRFALSHVKTKYVLFTLDDYFLINNVSNNRIYELTKMMDDNKIDYLRFYIRPKRATKGYFKQYDGIRMIDTSCEYAVNLYSSIWNKEFMMKTVTTRMNPWEFEVSLSNQAKKINARCVLSEKKDFEILDVVRKGKILHKANKYLKKHDLYHGDRELQTWSYEIKLGVKTFFARHLPLPLKNFVRKRMMKNGTAFFSQGNTK